MRKPSLIPRRLARLGRDQAGAAALETVCAVSLALTLATAAGDLGRALRGQARLEAAVSDAARMLTLTPLQADGTLLPGGVTQARAALAEGLAASGLSPGSLAEAPPGAACDAELRVCHRIDVIEGAEAALGRPRRLIRVWAAARVRARLLSAVLPPPDGGPGEGAGGTAGVARLTAALHQVHAR